MDGERSQIVERAAEQVLTKVEEAGPQGGSVRRRLQARRVGGDAEASAD